MRNVLLLVLLFSFLTSGCFTSKEINVSLASRSNNVCKTLTGNVVLYAIFVDSKHTKPWSEYDIKSTLDSIDIAMDWIVAKASEDSVPLNISIVHHQSKEGKIPITGDLSKKSLSATLFRTPQFSGIKDLYRWGDKIAIQAGKSLPEDTSAIVTTRNRIENRERLIARLRDIYKTDNVALMYFINNYYTSEVSVAIDINSTQNVEFAVVSYKKPATVAHEFLHLFGAWDLYLTPYDKKKDDRRRKKQAMEIFPNEIMAFGYRSLEFLEISDFTKYAIGWCNKLDKKYSDLILGKKLKPLTY